MAIDFTSTSPPYNFIGREFYYENEPGLLDTKIETTFWEVLEPFGVNMHFGGYDCWGDSPDTNPVAIMCNGELFK